MSKRILDGLSSAFLNVLPPPRAASMLKPVNASNEIYRVSVVGGGFGGLHTAIRLCDMTNGHIRVDLHEPRERFTFTPLLCELALGRLKATDVAPSMSSLVQPYAKSMAITQSKVTSIDTEARTITSENGESTPWDALVLSTGSIREESCDVIGATEHSLPFYSIEDALKLRSTLEVLKHRSGEKKVCVVGGGYSGVELAVGLASDGYSVTLIERSSHLLMGCHPFTEQTATRALKKHNVDIKLNTQVQRIGPDSVALDSDVLLHSDLTLWTAGSRPLTHTMQFNPQIKLNKRGQILVDYTLKSIDHDRIFAVGDIAGLPARHPNTAQVAMQQAEFAAWNVWCALNVNENGTRTPGMRPMSFSYNSLGEMLSLGDTDGSLAGSVVNISGPLAALTRRLVYAARMPGAMDKVKRKAEEQFKAR